MVEVHKEEILVVTVEEIMAGTMVEIMVETMVEITAALVLAQDPLLHQVLVLVIREVQVVQVAQVLLAPLVIVEKVRHHHLLPSVALVLEILVGSKVEIRVEIRVEGLAQVPLVLVRTSLVYVTVVK